MLFFLVAEEVGRNNSQLRFRQFFLHLIILSSSVEDKEANSSEVLHKSLQCVSTRSAGLRSDLICIE